MRLAGIPSRGDGNVRPRSNSRAAFTLLEVLCVLAVIALLAAMLFPGFAAARRSASRARTKVQFTQWTAAIEAFRSEYGFYPQFDPSGLVNGGVTTGDHPFHDVLAGRRRDGTTLPASSAAAQQNPRQIAFHVFFDGDFTAAGLIRDAGEDTAIAVLVDRDLDGVVKPGADFTSFPAVNGLVPTENDFPTSGVRAGVIFYAAAPGATAANPDFIFSWK